MEGYNVGNCLEVGFSISGERFACYSSLQAVETIEVFFAGLGTNESLCLVLTTFVFILGRIGK